MKIKLWKKPKNPIIIEGFPGFGLVGTIASEFLIDHLKTEQIGKIIFDDMPALVAIHDGKIIEPFGVFYNKKYNMVIVHAIGGSSGVEWKMSDVILKLAKDFNAKEIISIEGVASKNEEEESKTFYYTNSALNEKKFKQSKISPLSEGIIMGVTSALLLKCDKINVSCIFADAHTNMPDSKAAAEAIKALDAYLGLKIDYKPLLDMAEKFEEKLQGIAQQSRTAAVQRDRKALSYVG